MKDQEKIEIASKEVLSDMGRFQSESIPQGEIAPIFSNEDLELCKMMYLIGQRELIESSSTGFDQWLYKGPEKCDIREFSENNDYYKCKEAWIAARIDSKAEIESLDNQLGVKDAYIEMLQSTIDHLKEESDSLKNTLTNETRIRQFYVSKTMELKRLILVINFNFDAFGGWLMEKSAPTSVLAKLRECRKKSEEGELDE